MENIFEFDIDLKKQNYVKEPVLTQNDDATFRINIFDNDNPVDLSNVTTITLANVRLDRKSIVIPGNRGDKENQLVFGISRPENAVVGRVEATVQLYDSDSRVSTAKFSYKVVKDPSNISLTDEDKTLVQVVIGDGPLVIEQAQEATERASLAADYVDEKKPLIDKFTGEQTNLQAQVDKLVVEGDSSPAAAQAAVGADGTNHPTLKARLDAEQNKVAQQLADAATNVGDFFVNVKQPPIPLTPCEVDNVTDDTVALQAILDYVGSLGGGTVFVPRGTLIKSVAYVPDKVVLKGSGYGTILKLMDNCPLVAQGFPTGIYCRKNVSFFGVEDLVYDGNALNNVDLNSITNANFNANMSHGISNFYADADTDKNGSAPDDCYAEDFLFQRIYIKNTVRNTLLISGRRRGTGVVNDATLENAYTDHLIYESHTNSVISYKNIKLKGFWRGSAITAETGNFDGVKLTNVLKNPSPNFGQSGFLDLRDSFASELKAKPTFRNLVLDMPFANIYYLFSSQSTKPPKESLFENIIINQTDNISSSTGSPLAVFNSTGNQNVTFRGLELNNIKEIILLAARAGSRNLTFYDVHIRYSESRDGTSYSDYLIGVNNSIPGEISNILIENVFISDKAPSMLYYRSPSQLNTVKLDNIVFRNLNLKTDKNNTIPFNTGDNRTLFPTSRLKAIDSKWDGYGGLSVTVRNTEGLDLENCYHNGIPSRFRKVVSLPSGVSSVTVDYPFIVQRPRTIIATPITSIEGQAPFLLFSHVSEQKLTLSVPTPPTKTQEYNVYTDF